MKPSLLSPIIHHETITSLPYNSSWNNHFSLTTLSRNKQLCLPFTCHKSSTFPFLSFTNHENTLVLPLYPFSSFPLFPFPPSPEKETLSAIWLVGKRFTWTRIFAWQQHEPFAYLAPCLTVSLPSSVSLSFFCPLSSYLSFSGVFPNLCLPYCLSSCILLQCCCVVFISTVQYLLVTYNSSFL